MQTHLFYQQNCNYPFLPFDFRLRHSNVSLLLPSHNLHQMSQCSVFKVHLELSLIEAFNRLNASINAISGGFSPRYPNRSPAQRVRFGRGRRSQRNVVFAHFSQRENGMQLASSDVLVGQSGLEPPTSRLSVVCSSQLSYWPIFLSESGDLCFVPVSPSGGD